MGLRQLFGYFFLMVAIVGTIVAVSAARYFSRERVYRRQLRRERSARHKKQSQEHAKRTEV